ncbi:MAG TPA: hypothetical protein VGH11_00325 [Jatrophihabitans sp.]|jgi:hypothetical protein
MKRRLLGRAAVAIALAAVGASFAFLAHPAGASQGIDASVKHGCQNGGWVEVSLNVHSADDSGVYQVGLTSDGSRGPDSQYDEGGPGIVVTSDQKATVRLAGPASPGDEVFVRRLDVASSAVLPIPTGCADQPTNFGLQAASLSLTDQSCISNSAARINVNVTNPNQLDKQTDRAGLGEIDYTVLLVGADGTLMSNLGELVPFDGPGAGSVDLTMAAAQTTTYQVRVIGVDGQVVTSNNFSASCGHVSTPPPSSTPPPTRTPPTTTPTTPAPPPSTPPTHPTVHNPPPSSSAHRPTPGTSTSVSTSQSASGVVISNSVIAPSPNSSSSSATVGGFAGSPLVPSSTPHRSTPPTASPTDLTPVPSPGPPTQQYLADLPSGTSSLLNWQSDAALIVIVDALAISGLVGATVWRTRRR